MRSINTVAKKLFIGIVLLSLVWIRVSKNAQPTNALTTICPGTYNISLSTTSGTAISSATGLVQLSLNATSVPTTTINRVFFFMDGASVLGRGGLQSGSSIYSWSMLWNSAVSPNGSRFLSADVYYSDGTACTVNTTTAVLVNNPTAAPFGISQIFPGPSWTGPTNNNIDFEIVTQTGGTTIDLRPYMIYEWSTSIGSVTPTPAGYIGKFSSGPAAGTGQVNVLVKYAGRVIPATIPVSVFSSSTSTTTTTTQQNTTTGTTAPATQTTTGSTAPTSPTLTTKLLLSDPTIRQCLIKNIGEARVVAIESELSRPSATEFEQYQICFAKRSFVVASTLAPVAPTEVKALEESNKVVIAGAENTKEKIEGVDKEKLVFKGKGAPNSTVLIYVFSEPLVLATTTDSSGEWTYTLEDPLEPGSHEAYALVNKGDGTYQRSSPFSFLIGRAEASASNPQGYGLSLQIQPTATGNNRSANLFISGIIFIVVFSMTLVIFYLIRRAKTKPSNDPNSESISNNTLPPSGEN